MKTVQIPMLRLSFLVIHDLLGGPARGRAGSLGRAIFCDNGRCWKVGVERAAVLGKMKLEEGFFGSQNRPV